MNRYLSSYISALILLIFTVLFIIKGNYEFLTYTVTIGILIYFLAWTDKFFSYSELAKWGFTAWLFLHLSGGFFYFGGTRLYDIVLIPLVGDPYHILRYDQLMHIFSYFILTMFTYFMIASFAVKKTKPVIIGTAAFLAGMGIGAINEIIEFSTVIMFKSTGVGDYYNNALDSVFNAVGALIAVFTEHNGRYKK